MGRITVLPHWILPNTLPSVYDTESGSWIEMAGKLYGAIRELQTDYNSFVDETNQAITDFINSTDKDQEEFENHINKIVHDYIAMIDEKIKMQDSVIAEAVKYMKDNLVTSIKDLNENNELDHMIVKAMSNVENELLNMQKDYQENLNTKQVNYENNINNLVNEYNKETDQKIRSLASGSPLVASSISEMTDTTKTYVNTTDGNWYYYNGTEWVIGGTYQSTEIEDGSITIHKLAEELKSAFEINEEVTIPLNFDIAGWYSRSGALEENTSNSTCKYEVTPGEVYHYKGYTAGNMRGIIMLDENSSYLGNDYMIPQYDTYEQVTTYHDEIIKIPENCKYLYILNYSQAKGTTFSKVINYKAKVEEAKIDFYKLAEELQNAFEIDEETIIPLNFDIEGWYARNGVFGESTTNTTCKYEVTPGEVYHYKGYTIGNMRGIIMLDVNSNYLGNDYMIPQYDTYEQVTTYHDEIIKIPENCKYLYILNYSQAKGTTFSKVINYKAKVENENENYEIEKLKTFIIENQLKNDFAWKSFSGTKYAVFTFDDSNTDIDLIEDLFESKGVPCCFATIPTKLNNICTNGETVKKVLQRAVLNGGEVLSHYGSPLTSSSTDEDYKTVYEQTKKDLEKEGFEVNGIITAGGTNYNTQDWEKAIKLARTNYLYADLTATGFTNIEQYYNRRNFLDNGFNEIKTLIDNYISGTGTQPHSKWLNFASHGTNTNELSVFENIIDYCLENNIQIVTWKTIYDTFKSSKLEERIKLLEA